MLTILLNELELFLKKFSFSHLLRLTQYPKSFPGEALSVLIATATIPLTLITFGSENSSFTALLIDDLKQQMFSSQQSASE